VRSQDGVRAPPADATTGRSALRVVPVSGRLVGLLLGRFGVQIGEPVAQRSFQPGESVLDRRHQLESLGRHFVKQALLERHESVGVPGLASLAAGPRRRERALDVGQPVRQARHAILCGSRGVERRDGSELGALLGVGGIGRRENRDLVSVAVRPFGRTGALSLTHRSLLPGRLMLFPREPPLKSPSGTVRVVPSLARINVTPVKSLALSHPERTSLGRAGLASDRLFFLVDSGGRVFSGSDHGPLVRVRPTYDALADRLELAFPDGTVIGGDGGLTGDPLQCDFYGRDVAAHLIEGPFGEALSRFAGTTVRVARCDRPGDGTDVHHVTVVSRASVEELSRQGGREGPLDPRRFRMNFELDGCTPHEEDSWGGRQVRVGEAVLRLLGEVPRCVVTTQDPGTGRKDFDTLKVIARYRAPDGSRPRIPFGMYAEVDRPGAIAVGDEVELLG
jgi:uncharacterized protein